MRGLFLCAFKQRHPNYDIDYNDIKKLDGINIVGNALIINLNKYDYLLATPPCNYWSKCNYRRNVSEYALKTKNLLPDILIKFAKSGKPFLIENVRNAPLFQKEGIFEICSKYGIYVQFVGRHTYFSNIEVDLNCPQVYDFNHKDKGYTIRLHSNSQGGSNTFNCFEIWLKEVIKND